MNKMKIAKGEQKQLYVVAPGPVNTWTIMQGSDPIINGLRHDKAIWLAEMLNEWGPQEKQIIKGRIHEV